MGTLRETGNIRSLEYQFIAKPKDNGAVYKCVASNANVPEPHREESITVAVFCKYLCCIVWRRVENLCTILLQPAQACFTLPIVK